MTSHSDVARWNHVEVPDRVRERAYKQWTPDGGCWISTYSVASHGYAQIGWQKRPKRYVILAHRAAWEYVNGPMPTGMTLDHLCKSKRCVNPDHLRVLDNYENARRTSGRDWPLGECVNGHSNDYLEEFSGGRMHCGICARFIWKKNPRTTRVTRLRTPLKPSIPKPPKTHCRNGHEKSIENTYVRPHGRTECLACKRSSATTWHAAKRPTFHKGLKAAVEEVNQHPVRKTA